MVVQSVCDLAWINPEKTAFNCKVTFVGSTVVLPFCCNIVEVGHLDHVTQIWNNAMAGEYGPIADYAAPVVYPDVEPQPDQPVVEGAMTL